MALKSSDFLDGGKGNDFLNGKSGADTYVFGKGYGFDYIADVSNLTLSYEDTVLFTPDVSPEDIVITGLSDINDTDFIISFNDDTSQLRIEDQVNTPTIGSDIYRIEYFQFQDEAQTRWSWQDVYEKFSNLPGQDGYNAVAGTDTDDVLTSQSSRDYLSGGFGSDIYEYNLGGGADVIEDLGGYGEVNIIRFGNDINPDSVELSRGALKEDLHITFGNATDSLSIVGNFEFGMFVGYPDDIDRIEFSNGDVWDNAFIRQQISGFTSQSDNVIGFNGKDVIEGGAGNDYLDGQGDSDQYIYNVGDGHDVIDDNGLLDEDTLVFGAGIAPESLFLRQQGKDLLITLIGRNDWLTVRDQFGLEYERSIEKFTFKDGTQWVHQNVLDILANANNENPVAKNDMGFRQTSNTDLLINAADLVGNDIDEDSHTLSILSVGESKDGFATLMEDGSVKFTPDSDFVGTAEFSYVVHDGHGGYSNTALVTVSIDNGSALEENQLVGSQGSDKLRGGDENDVLTGLAGNDELLGRAGDDQLFGGEGDDFLNGGKGKDVLKGGKGNDTYYYQSFDSRNIISDDGSSENDTVSFGDNILLEDVLFQVRAGKLNDLDITTGVEGDLVRVIGQFSDLSRIETFSFSNGQTLSWLQVEDMLKA